MAKEIVEVLFVFQVKSKTSCKLVAMYLGCYGLQNTEYIVYAFTESTPQPLKRYLQESKDEEGWSYTKCDQTANDDHCTDHIEAPFHWLFEPCQKSPCAYQHQPQQCRYLLVNAVCMCVRVMD